MIKRAVAMGVLWAVIAMVVAYFILLGFDIPPSSEGAFFIIIVLIMLPVQIGCMAYLTVLIESIRPQVKK
jgi:hypothetical protein